MADRSGVSTWLTPLNALQASVYLLGVVFTLYTIYYAYSLFFIRLRYSNLFVDMGITLFYLNSVRGRYEAAEAADGIAVDTSGTIDGDSGDDDDTLDEFRSLVRRIDPLLALGLALLTL